MMITPGDRHNNSHQFSALETKRQAAHYSCPFCFAACTLPFAVMIPDSLEAFRTD